MREQSNIKTWPERIYLQHGDSPEVPAFHEVHPGNGYSDGVTWCQDRIEPADVEYVRADVAAAPELAQEPVEPKALALAIAELDQLANSDDGDLWPSQAESVLLVLHELSRLRSAQPETWKVLPSPVRVTGEMLHQAFPEIPGEKWPLPAARKAVWERFAERVNARLTGELKQEAKE